MKNRLSRLVLIVLLACASWLAWVVLVPVELPSSPYSITIGPNRTLSQVARSLAQEGVIRNRQVLVALARLQGSDRRIKAGLYRFNGSASMWAILSRFTEGHPDEASVTVIEGWTFRQFRQLVDQSPDVVHLSAQWSDAQILQSIGASETQAEGLFFPSTYYFVPGSSDVELYRRAYQTMQQHLNLVWQTRGAGLPLSTPYQLLTLASLIERETASEQDRTLVAAVFINRLKKKMRLQTDPSVIYGMGDLYQGHIGSANLRRDTPYNTYTRAGLTPTPIALPGDASLVAAAHPAPTNVLFFVSRGDGRSFFSETLQQHDDAVRRFILKKAN